MESSEEGINSLISRARSGGVSTSRSPTTTSAGPAKRARMSLLSVRMAMPRNAAAAPSGLVALIIAATSCFTFGSASGASRRGSVDSTRISTPFSITARAVSSRRSLPASSSAPVCVSTSTRACARPASCRSSAIVASRNLEQIENANGIAGDARHFGGAGTERAAPEPATIWNDEAVSSGERGNLRSKAIGIQGKSM